MRELNFGDTARYWNQVAWTKEFHLPVHLDLLDTYIDQDARILDYGCGYGRVLQELHEYGYRHLLGLDLAEQMVARGRELFPHLDLRVLVNQNVPCPNQTFDAVILFAVLTCIVRNQDQHLLLHEILRVLQPGGILYITDFLLNQDERNIARYEHFQRKYGTYGVFELEDGGVVRHHSEQWVRKLLQRLDTREYWEESVITMNGHPARAFGFIGQKGKE